MAKKTNNKNGLNGFLVEALVHKKGLNMLGLVQFVLIMTIIITIYRALLGMYS